MLECAFSFMSLCTFRWPYAAFSLTRDVVSGELYSVRAVCWGHVLKMFSPLWAALVRAAVEIPRAQGSTTHSPKQRVGAADYPAANAGVLGSCHAQVHVIN